MILAEQPVALQSVFRALADPTRRGILVLLSHRDMTIAEVSDHFDMTRAAVKKHLTILREGRIISVDKRGRERINHLEPAALKEATGLFMIVSVSADPTVGPRLQVLSFEGCPNAGILAASLEEACAQLGLPVSLIEYVDLGDLDDDDPRRGWGSPTILVDGADLMGLEPPAGAAISCRIYPGNILPTARQIAARLRKQ